jgi:hypothetical protein
MKIKESGRGLHVQCCYGSPKGGGKTGVDISDVHFKRIDIDDTCEPICVMAGSAKSTAHLKDIEFREITAESAMAPSVTGAGKTRPCNISFRDCSFLVGTSIPGARADDKIDLYRGGGRGAFLIKDADRVSFRNTVLKLDQMAK